MHVCTYARYGVSYLNEIICSLCYERGRFRVQEIELQTEKKQRYVLRFAFLSPLQCRCTRLKQWRVHNTEVTLDNFHCSN